MYMKEIKAKCTEEQIKEFRKDYPLYNLDEVLPMLGMLTGAELEARIIIAIDFLTNNTAFWNESITEKLQS